MSKLPDSVSFKVVETRPLSRSKQPPWVHTLFLQLLKLQPDQSLELSLASFPNGRSDVERLRRTLIYMTKKHNKTLHIRSSKGSVFFWVDERSKTANTEKTGPAPQILTGKRPRTRMA